MLLDMSKYKDFGYQVQCGESLSKSVLQFNRSLSRVCVFFPCSYNAISVYCEHTVGTGITRPFRTAAVALLEYTIILKCNNITRTDSVHRVIPVTISPLSCQWNLASETTVLIPSLSQTWCITLSKALKPISSKGLSTLCSHYTPAGMIPSTFCLPTPTCTCQTQKCTGKPCPTNTQQPSSSTLETEISGVTMEGHSWSSFSTTFLVWHGWDEVGG